MPWGRGVVCEVLRVDRACCHARAATTFERWCAKSSQCASWIAHFFLREFCGWRSRGAQTPPRAANLLLQVITRPGSRREETGMEDEC
jgi:hypothetical protein